MSKEKFLRFLSVFGKFLPNNDPKIQRLMVELNDFVEAISALAILNIFFLEKQVWFRKSALPNF